MCPLSQVSRADPNLVVALAMRDWEFTWEMDGSCRHDRWWRQLLAPFYDVLVTWFNHRIVWRLMELPFVELYKEDLTELVAKFLTFFCCPLSACSSLC